MASFVHDGSIKDLQDFGGIVYTPADDRLFSIWDLLAHEQRFAMRALKGIRKGDDDKLRLNLFITFSFLLAIANRLHINMEDIVWRRFPMLCSYCGERPCVCKKIKLQTRQGAVRDDSLRPKTLAAFQAMFNAIYPANQRSLTDAGIHLAEEIGEVTEAIQNFLGQHLEKQFLEIQDEMADCASCIFGVANSADIDLAKEFEKQFYDNCYVCHHAPCSCTFDAIALIRT